MSNDYFNVTGTPGTRTPGASAPMRAQFALLETAFDKAPPLVGNGLKLVRVKADETGLESVDSATIDSQPRTCIAISCSDETTPIASGTSKVSFINPFATAFAVTKIVASLRTAQASGSIFTVDVNEAGVSMLSTKLTIDNTEKSTATAATPAVLSDTSIAAYAEITVDVDQIGDGTATGLKIYILGYPT